MAYTPVEIRRVDFPRGVGYRRAAVDRLLADVAQSFEDVWRERADLADRVEQLEAEIERYRELETLLRTTLVSAERAGEELREQARRETAGMGGEARAEARLITRQAFADRERLLAEARRIRALLRSALTVVEESGVEGQEPGAQAA